MAATLPFASSRPELARRGGAAKRAAERLPGDRVVALRLGDQRITGLAVSEADAKVGGQSGRDQNVAV